MRCDDEGCKCKLHSDARSAMQKVDEFVGSGGSVVIRSSIVRGTVTYGVSARTAGGTNYGKSDTDVLHALIAVMEMVEGER